jgi:hypothetical protein
VTDSWEAVTDLFKDFASNSTRLAKLGRKLQEGDLWWVVMIQVEVFCEALEWWDNPAAKFAVTQFPISPKSCREYENGK